MKDIRTLVVAGENGVARSWLEPLRDVGANVTVVADGTSAVRHLAMLESELVIVDLRLPGTLDGFDTCRAIRTGSCVPVVIASPSAGPYDEIVALAVGADHFVGGDTEVEVVVARLRSLVRRVRGDVMVGSGLGAPSGPAARGRSMPESGRRTVREAPRPQVSHAGVASPQLTLMGGAGPDVLDERIVDGELEIDLVARDVRVAGVEVPLTRIEFDLLVALARHPRRVLTRDQLMVSAWDEPFDGSHVLDTHLSRMRVKIQQAGGGRVAHAVRGVGYRLRE